MGKRIEWTLSDINENQENSGEKAENAWENEEEEVVSCRFKGTLYK